MAFRHVLRGLLDQESKKNQVKQPEKVEQPDVIEVIESDISENENKSTIAEAVVVPQKLNQKKQKSQKKGK